MLNLISTKFDKFFINQYISPSEFGVYSIAFLSIPILGQFFQSIHNVVVPEIALKMSKNSIKEVILIWQKTVEKTSSVTIPAVFLFWLMANEIVTILYTQEYLEAAKYYRIFILMFFVSMFSHNLILRGANKTKYILVSDIIGTLLTLIVGFLIIPRLGLYGAIITALIGTILPMIISLQIERKIMKLKFKNWVDWRKIGMNFLICFLITAPLFLFKDYINNLFLRLVIIIPIYIILVVVFQIKYNLFIFTQYISKIKKYISI